jgi:hypothetical protein
MVAVVAAIHSLMGRRNFTGWDEWLILDLTSRGLISNPHASRPLALLWLLPGPWLSPASPFDGFHWLHCAYTSGIGLATVVIARRLLGGILLPWCAGVLAAVWAPTDPNRLATILTSAHVSFACAAVAATALLAESWCRQSRWLLGAATLVAFAAIRSYEPAAVLLVGAPLLLLALPRPEKARRLEWLAVFGSGLAVGALLALIPPAGIARGQLYQDAASFDLRPLHVATRLVAQLRSLLQPAFNVPPLTGATLAVWLAPILVLLAGALVARSELALGRPPRSTPIPRVALVASAWTLLGLAPFSLSAVFEPGVRAQFLSAPGVGLGLAVAVGSLAGLLRPRLRAALVLLATAWLVFVAAEWTAAMQAEWSKRSLWPRQRSLLGQLAAAVPDVRPGTLFILIDQSQAFESTFAFRHAVHYLYEGRAAGWVVSSRDLDLFYPTRLAEDGVHADVWPAHQRAWDESPRVYAYHETVVVWVEPRGTLWLLGTWPATALPALPPGARYAPRERLLGGAPSRTAQRLLANVR